VTVSGSAILDIQNSGFHDGYDPVIFTTDNSIARIESSVVRHGKTYGVSARDKATVYANGCKVYGHNGSACCMIGDGNLHLTNSEIYENGNSALEIYSTDHIHIEVCVIRDHLKSAGLVVKGQTGVFISKSQILRTGVDIPTCSLPPSIWIV